MDNLTYENLVKMNDSEVVAMHPCYGSTDNTYETNVFLSNYGDEQMSDDRKENAAWVIRLRALAQENKTQLESLREKLAIAQHALEFYASDEFCRVGYGGELLWDYDIAEEALAKIKQEEK